MCHPDLPFEGFFLMVACYSADQEEKTVVVFGESCLGKAIGEPGPSGSWPPWLLTQLFRLSRQRSRL